MPPRSDADVADAERPLRADAARNRALILETAAEVFAERGLDAGYDEIARRAGVGVGTVYRRFPERDELVRALFASRIDEVVALAERVVDLPSAWQGLEVFLAGVAEMQVADRGLKEVMARTISSDEHRMVGRDRLEPLIGRLVTRAQAEGDLRGDVVGTDLGVLLMLLSSLSTADRPDLWRRYLPLALEGLRARPGAEALPLDGPDDDTLHDLMANLHRP